MKIVAPLLIRGRKNLPLSPFWPMKKSQCERKHGGAFCVGFKKVVPRQKRAKNVRCQHENGHELAKS
jgi:hypothetical protein